MPKIDVHPGQRVVATTIIDGGQPGDVGVAVELTGGAILALGFSLDAAHRLCGQLMAQALDSRPASDSLDLERIERMEAMLTGFKRRLLARAPASLPH